MFVITGDGDAMPSMEPGGWAGCASSYDTSTPSTSITENELLMMV